ncbi:MAG: LamG-like jellyroll fold domain-containing protein [Blastopirellula sp. JB062]
MDDKLSQLESLLIEWEAGEINDAGIARLRELLKEDAEARSYFLQWQALTAALDLESHVSSLPEIDPLRDAQPTWPKRAPASVSRTGLSLALALSLLLAAVLSWAAFRMGDGAPNGDERLAASGTAAPLAAELEKTSYGVAILTRLVDAEWAQDQRPRNIGEALSPGDFRLKSGLAQIEFFCGATIVVEGPADLDLQSSIQAIVRQGKIRALVPPAARGFSLEAERLTIVDLGTEFGMSVSPDSVNVQVFDGEIEVRPDSQPMRRVVGGQSMIIADSGDMRQAELQPEQFVDLAELESRAERQSSARFARWQAWSESVRRNPRLVAYYPFQQLNDGMRRLSCELTPADHELDGAIIGARTVAGRWERKDALEFKQPADRVRVQIPGAYQALTFACWTRIDSLDRMFNSLFLTDGYDKGEPHWQILDTGQMYFSVRPVDRLSKTGPKDFKALSPPFWRPSLQGKWIHLAVTCDWETNEIVHYLNGEPLSRHTVPSAQMPDFAQIGMASIGNWDLPTLPDAEFAIRNLNGSIDEFMIFSSALAANEIREMYEIGKP